MNTLDPREPETTTAGSKDPGAAAGPGQASGPDGSAYALVGDEPGFTTGADGAAVPADAVPGAPTAGQGSPGPDRTGQAAAEDHLGQDHLGQDHLGQDRPGEAPGAASAAGEPEGAWRQVLIDFVDHPRQAVEQADRLVDEAVRSLADRISREHSGLRAAWHDHGEPSTEDLRKALRGYREFFEKVLSSR